MGIMITCQGYNNPVYNEHRNVGVHYLWKTWVIRQTYNKKR